MGKAAKAGLLFRTARHLKFRQIASRAATPVRVKTEARLGRWSTKKLRDRMDVPGWPGTYTPSLLTVGAPGDATAILAGNVTILGHAHFLGDAQSWDWHPQDVPRLWSFTLNYWEWAGALVGEPTAAVGFGALWRNWWEQTQPGVGDQWEPYVVALRAWSWCSVAHALVQGAPNEGQFNAILDLHRRYLARRLENDLGGNHLLKDLKALAGLDVYLGNASAPSSMRDFESEVDVQVLPDGGHEERSPAYHVQVMFDVWDVWQLAKTVGLCSTAHRLGRLYRRMQDWLVVVEEDGRLPAFNDGYPPRAAELEFLTAARPRADKPLVVLPDTGLAVITIGNLRAILDVGAIGPDYNPGHGHADTLGFELLWQGLPVLVEAGTSTYESGVERSYERSTAAHNTISVNGRNSSEVWGVFRVGRRARVHNLHWSDEGGRVTVSCEHDGYGNRKTAMVTHRRTWTFDATGVLIEDELTGEGAFTTEVHWHLDPRLSGSFAERRFTLDQPNHDPAGHLVCEVIEGAEVDQQSMSSPVARGYLAVTPGPYVLVRVSGKKRVFIRTDVRIHGHRRETSEAGSPAGQRWPRPVVVGARADHRSDAGARPHGGFADLRRH